jgi:ABC-2 type transport system permease protein
MSPTSQAVLNYLSITTHLEDFMGGVIDTRHVVYYLSFIAFGLFLTARSVDVERWRG